VPTVLHPVVIPSREICSIQEAAQKPAGTSTNRPEATGGTNGAGCNACPKKTASSARLTGLPGQKSRRPAESTEQPEVRPEKYSVSIAEAAQSPGDTSAKTEGRTLTGRLAVLDPQRFETVRAT
jgi:hypothetical protein